RKRGQQPGRPGRGRRACATLPVVDEVRDLSTTERRCPSCGEAFRPFPGPRSMHHHCSPSPGACPSYPTPALPKVCRYLHIPGVVTATPAPRLMAKSTLGVSVWTEVVLDKYLYGRPTARLCQALQHQGVPLSPGTVTDGLRKITPLVEPVVQAL